MINFVEHCPSKIDYIVNRGMRIRSSRLVGSERVVSASAVSSCQM